MTHTENNNAELLDIIENQTHLEFDLKKVDDSALINAFEILTIATEGQQNNLKSLKRTFAK